MTKGIKNFFLSVFICVILMASFGCEGKKMEDPEGMLKARAVEYWNMRFIQKDTRATYEMEAEKNRVPLKVYEKQVKNAGQLTYSKITVGEFSITGDKATVEMKITYSVPGFPKALDGEIVGDQWIIEKNQWMHLLKEKKHVIPK